ncbi:hypothetical protein DUI87_20701 [Hirundo rustica rustica]|uniref:RNA-directed DNA polymerase n=1 Tax=Hirundo rustica rustica TaxID=333673 RepID=A0A3M0JR62_HIRRU|nr:hypothetical protein DUI87_20701 [Hirundo rustica rustica]
MHVRSHTDLPGEIAEGNRQADSLAAPVENARLPDIFQQAKLSHQQYHQNVPGLIHQFQLTWSQAQAIVATCPNCQVQAMPSIGIGVNPRGLGSCEVWQTDITHIPSFGHLKYVHVSIDTHSGAVYASADAGEKTEHAKKHLVQAFSVLGIPKEIKTDNGPAYASKEFLEFFQQWGVEHKTGIPHSPTEKTYLTLSPVMNPIQVVILLLLNSLAAAWIIPQPRQNIWVTLAQTFQQENIYLSTASTDNPMSTCLVGIPLQAGEFPAGLDTHRSNKIPEPNTFRPYKGHQQKSGMTVNPLEEWLPSLLKVSQEPQELELLGSSPASYCIHFSVYPKPSNVNEYRNIKQYREEFSAKRWCHQNGSISPATVYVMSAFTS